MILGEVSDTLLNTSFRSTGLILRSDNYIFFSNNLLNFEPWRQFRRLGAAIGSNVPEPLGCEGGDRIGECLQ